jgi:hypothetical protein
MAGAGYKLFQTGDVLTAAQVNTYLNEQTVMVFANAAARTSALTSVLAEGMVSYLQDTNAVEVYNGSAWVGVSGAGDVTEVQAGTGISVASGTGPIPVVTNTMATAVDAKGDLIVGTGADTFARLAVGTNGHTLVADSAEATGLKWAAPAGGGKVLQVVEGLTTTSTNIATTSLTDTTITATITPSSASSKVLVMVAAKFYAYRGGSSPSEYTVAAVLLRGATIIADYDNNGDEFNKFTMGQNSISMEQRIIQPIIKLDSPATTSAVTYKLQARVRYTSNSGQVTFQDESTPSTIILMEIGA